ncbi:MAG: choloylglycine hydrolase [Clostridia bacterium]|nr:choloylglycine hydrolase [Clostridia bacterium]
MCTAISVTNKNHYFGRNLDYEHTFGEKITVTPRNYKFCFRNGTEIKTHPAIIGMALPMDNYPLYFDATNESGLSVAGLNFPDNASYMEKDDAKDNVASFELIPWILCKCKTVSDAEKLLANINITDESFNDKMPPSPLHWIISDKKKSITLEQTKSGIKVYDNPVGVLTNNPSFDMQMLNLSNYLHVSPNEPENKFSDKINLKIYSRGMGGIGLPGDLSSMSRFVRACFTKLNSVYGSTESETVNQFFHILYSVYQQKGCAKVGEDYEITNYSSCCNTDTGVYYYTTYNNYTINAVDMHKENLDSDKLVTYELLKQETISIQNRAI